MSGKQVPYGSSAWWVRQVTPDLAVELWPGDGALVRLLSSSHPVKVALGDLGALTEALQEVVSALGEAADVELDAMGPVIEQADGEWGV
jgi:hypothetical protein